MIFRGLLIDSLFFFSLIGGIPIYAQGTIAQGAVPQGSVKESEQLDFAQGLLSRGMYDMAIMQYQKFISDYPHSLSLQDAYLSLGEVYFYPRILIKLLKPLINLTSFTLIQISCR